MHLSQKQATGQQLIDKICEKLNLLEKEYFSCTYTQRDVKVKKMLLWHASVLFAIVSIVCILFDDDAAAAAAAINESYLRLRCTYSW